MDDSPLVDVFISFHPTDAAAAQALAHVLTTHALSVRCEPLRSEWPQQSAERFASALRAKTFVAWISTDYCVHAVAQREFMLAFAAANALHQARERLVIIDALDPKDASLPPMLRETCHVARHDDIQATARWLGTNAKQLAGPLQTERLPDFSTQEFAGQIGQLWQLHEALFARSKDKPRAVVTGDAGAGKSWLLNEYANTFALTYSAGVFRLDAGWFDKPSPTDFERVREHAWRQLAVKLAIDTRGLAFDRVEARVAERLQQANGRYLWIVDHMPAGQTLDAIFAWCAPTSAGATIIASREQDYISMGAHIVVGGLDDDSARVLLERSKSMATPQEIAGGRQLIEQLGHHALALQLAAGRLARSTYDRLLLQLAAPPTDAARLADALAEQLALPQLVGIAVSLHRTIAQLSAPARQVLRLAAVLASTPVPLALINTSLAQRTRGSTTHASITNTQIAIDELLGFGLAQRADEDHLSVTSLVRSSVIALDKEHEINAARDLLLATLAGELPQMPEASDTNAYAAWLPHILHLARTATPSSPLIEVNAWLARFDRVGSLRSANRRAVTLLEQGDLNNAQQLLDMELASRRMGLGEDHPQTATPVNNLAVALSLRGEFGQARTLLERAIDVRRRALGDQHSDLLTPLNNLGVVLWHEGEHRKARTIFERVVELRQQLLGETHPDTLVSMRNLAVALRNDGEFVAARNLLEHVVEVRRKALGTQHVDTCTAMASLAQTLREHSEAIIARISDTLTLDAPLLPHDRALPSA